MNTSSIDTQLLRLESELEALSVSLISGQADSLLSGSVMLQRLAVELMQMVGSQGLSQRALQPALPRMRDLATRIANLRENLLRRSAYVDRALEIVVPATRDKATYAGAGAYGQPVRQSGAFAVLSA